jgi:transcriptional regulator with XRE-family HTH domain
MKKERNNDEFLKAVGNNIRQMRKARGLTIEELAEKCSLHFTNLGKIERGKSDTSLTILTRIAAALGVPSEDIIRVRAHSKKDLLLSRLLLEGRDLRIKDLDLIVTFISKLKGRLK